MGEKEREEESIRASSDDPRSSIGRNLSSQELKFIASTRVTCTYKKRGVSPKIQRKRFREIEGLGLGRLPTFLLRSKR